jgi:glutamate synthase (NADPH/NADH) large chain
VELLEVGDAIGHWKAEGLDLEPILRPASNEAGSPLRCVRGQDHGLDKALDNVLIDQAAPALEHGDRVTIKLPIRNVNRTVGTMLGHEVVRRHGGLGLHDGTIDVTLTGSAGQSFGAFLPRGIVLRLVGDANDYLGKGLSGGMITVMPPSDAGFVARENVIAGNVIGYGATSGEIFLSGVVGERFGVRNSGATLVVEGVGDHGCEYMTGGVVAILGPTGRNFAAGMSGGKAYVLDLDRDLISPGAVAGRSLLLDQMTPELSDDAEKLITLVERHALETGSELAEELLEDWPAALTRFTRVVPRDYAVMNAALAKARAEGRDYADPAVWAQIQKEVAHG